MIYIASPYTDRNKRPSVLISPLESIRFAQVSRYTYKLIQSGYAAFSPIVYGHHFSSIYGVTGDYQAWLSFNESMLRASSAMEVYMLDGWRESRGVTHEIEFATSLGLEIEYVNPAL